MSISSQKRRQTTKSDRRRKATKALNTTATPENPFDVGIRRRFTPSVRVMFLERLVKDPRIKNVAESLGFTASSIHSYMVKDPEFAAVVRDIIYGRIGELEDEAFRRATEGVEEPILYKGEVVTTVRRYSDTLAMFLLKGNKPEIYGPSRTGGDDQPVKFTINFGAGVADSDGDQASG